MKCSDLVKSVAHEISLPLDQANDYVEVFFDVLGEILAEHKRIELRGFGVFIPKHRAEKHGSHPQTQKPIFIPAKTTLLWRAAAELKERVDAETLED